MGGCGTFASGNNSDFVYQKAGEIEGVKILVGKPGTGKHILPEESHSPSTAYVRLDSKGVFREIRFYGPDHRITMEIGYHVDAKLSPNGKPVLHFHLYPDGKMENRTAGDFLTSAMKEKYKKFFKGVPL